MPRSYEARMDALRRLEDMVVRHQSALVEAVNQDFGRRATQETPPADAYAGSGDGSQEEVSGTHQGTRPDRGVPSS